MSALYEEYPSREHVIYLPDDRGPCNVRTYVTKSLLCEAAREREKNQADPTVLQRKHFLHKICGIINSYTGQKTLVDLRKCI